MATTRGNDTAVGWWMRADTAAPATATGTATGTGRVSGTATSVTAPSTNVIATAPCRVRVHCRARGPVARVGHPQHPANAVQRLEWHVRRGHAQPVLEPRCGRRRAVLDEGRVGVGELAGRQHGASGGRWGEAQQLLHVCRVGCSQVDVFNLPERPPSCTACTSLTPPAAP